MTSKTKKRLAISAGVCMGAGVLLAGAGFLLGGRPGLFVNASGIHSYHSQKNQSQGNLENTLEKTGLDEFSSMDIQLSIGNLTVIPSDGYYLEYSLPSVHGKIEYGVEDDEFSLKVQESQVTFFGFDWDLFSGFGESVDNYVNLYVPKEVYFEKINIVNDMGNISVPDIQADFVEMTLDLGNLEMGDVEGNTCILTLNSGNLDAGRIKCPTITLENDLGNIDCAALEGENVDITLDLGDFTAGQAQVSVLDVTCDLGNVSLSLPGTSTDYNLDLSADLGDVTLSQDGKSLDEDTGHYISHTDNDTRITVDCSCGNIDIEFK